MKAQIPGPEGQVNSSQEQNASRVNKTQYLGANDMKYILLMSGTKAGVDTYHAWSQKDIEAHMAALSSINKELTESGEFVATQGLAEPAEAKVVRGGKTVSRSQTVFSPSRRSFCWATGLSTSRLPNALMP
jgi:hypothetical protein